MFLQRSANLAAIVVVCVATVASAAPKPPPPPRAVQVGPDGRLTYHADPRGDRLPDFSHCGYLGGDAAVPDVPVRIVISPKPGDQTARIQSAIDHVASLTPGSDGFRGAVLLQPGR